MQFFVMTGSTTSTRFKNLELELRTGKLPTPEKLHSNSLHHISFIISVPYQTSKVSLLILILHCRILAFTRVNFSCNQSIFECSHFKNRYFISPMHSENLTKGQWKKPQKLLVHIEKGLL